MAGKPHRRAAASKCTASWHRRVNTELFQHSVSDYTKSRKRDFDHQAKPGIKSRWDPYDIFTDQEELTQFFSGREYRCHYLIDRERFAKFAIEGALADHPNDNFEITGEVMKHEFVTDQSNKAGALENLAREIRADGQQDIDAELPMDLTQKISTAAQSMIAAGPNCLGPPVDPCAAYLKTTKCGLHGRGNSTVWKSPLFPTLDNQDGRRGLLDHQVTGIVWLLSRLFGDLPTLEYECPWTGELRSNITNSSDEENRDRLKGPKYFGGIIADSMGLGKTLTTVALIDLLIRQKLNVDRDGDGAPRYRPILLITPNTVVASQWVQEFDQVIDESTLRHIVVSGPGLEAPSDSHRVIHLARENFKQWPTTLNYMWDEGNPEASQVVLIMTTDSWATRTCGKDEEGEWISSFTEEGRGFSLVIVDEAYKVKNPGTRNWRSVYFLERQFTLLITATPCMNTLTDLFGLARLLWEAPKQYLEQELGTMDEITDTFRELEDLDKLDCYPSSHDFQLAAGRPALLAKLLFNRKNAKISQDINMTRKYLKHFETLAMLKRSPSSYLYSDWEQSKSVSLEGLFPKVENYTVDIGVSEAYNYEYQRVHIDHLIDYLEGIRDWGSRFDGPTTKKEIKKEAKKENKKEEDDDDKGPGANPLRLLQLASSSLDVYDLDIVMRKNEHSTLAPQVAQMRENGVNLLRLARFLVLPGETQPNTHVGWLKLVTRNSPILRYILHYINENLLVRKESGPIIKLLIIEQNVMLAFYYELVLQFLGLKCRCMHAQLSLDERQKLIDSFNSSHRDSCQILIQMYTVGFAGTNLHRSCSRVLVASQSHSLPVQWQAIHRVIRVGQESDVTVHRVKLKNSFHTFRESRQIEKILPELGARAQGNMKKVLVRLLNLFQYEVRDAWYSPEGQKLLKEKNLLEDDKPERIEEPAAKKIKLENGSLLKIEDKTIKKEDEASSAGTLLLSRKRHMEAMISRAPEICKQEVIRTGDGSGGWFNYDPGTRSDTDAFLKLRTREAYYEEFLALPRKSRSRFNHSKNNLRRLLSYGNDNGVLSTEPWEESCLEDPAVLERALELMLRVRLGANDIAMLPCPMIDLSATSGRRRRHLQRLLADMTHTDQHLDPAGPVAAPKDLREPLRCTDVKKPLAEIERDLEAHAKFGDLKSSGAKKTVVIKEPESDVDAGDSKSDNNYKGRGDSEDPVDHNNADEGRVKAKDEDTSALGDDKKLDIDISNLRDEDMKEERIEEEEEKGKEDAKVEYGVEEEEEVEGEEIKEEEEEEEW